LLSPGVVWVGYGTRAGEHTSMNAAADPLREIRDAIDSATRYAARGCSGMACDRVRHAWMGNQLSAIGRAAEGASAEVRKALPGVPWDSLAELTD